MSNRTLPIFSCIACLFVLLGCCLHGRAQDAVTGSIRGVVEDPAGARLSQAHVRLTDAQRGLHKEAVTDGDGAFFFSLLAPGTYEIRTDAPDMAPLVQRVRVELGDALEVAVRLRIAGAAEEVSVEETSASVQTQPSAVSSVISEIDIDELPLNGRRFADLTLLTAGVTQDPRSLTSASNGDLAFGGLRGWQTSYLVDGADYNNSFFAQARGRYRTPYTFSNETVQEFRVSSNSYGAELGRAGGGVVNVVTRSGTNRYHGTGFYYLRDNAFAARHPFVDFKPE